MWVQFSFSGKTSCPTCNTTCFCLLAISTSICVTKSCNSPVSENCSLVGLNVIYIMLDVSGGGLDPNKISYGERPIVACLVVQDTLPIPRSFSIRLRRRFDVDLFICSTSPLPIGQCGVMRDLVTPNSIYSQNSFPD